MKHFTSRKRLNIAQVTPYYLPALGGIERTTHEISKRLVERGHRVTVYTSKSNFSDFNTLLDEEVIDGVKVRRFPEFLNVMSTWTPEIAQDEDILHLQNYNIHPHTYLIGKYAGNKPIVMTTHGGFSRYEGDFPLDFSLYGIGKYLWQYLYGKKYLKKVDLVLALHEWERQNLISKGAILSKTKILSNAMGDEAFAEYRPKSSDRPYILNITRVSKVKSLDQVIQILPFFPDLDFVIVGPDVGEGEQERLTELARELKVNDQLKFKGGIFGNEKYEYIAGCEALVVSSSWEMYSSTIIEGMAQGKVVIASDRFGNPHIMDDGKTGIIYKYGDLEDLRFKIKSVLENKEYARSIGESAKKFLWENKRWPSIMDQLESYYYNL